MSVNSTRLLKRADRVSITRVRRIGCACTITMRMQTKITERKTRASPMAQCHMRERRSRGEDVPDTRGPSDGAAECTTKLHVYDGIGRKGIRSFPEGQIYGL